MKKVSFVIAHKERGLNEDTLPTNNDMLSNLLKTKSHFLETKFNSDSNTLWICSLRSLSIKDVYTSIHGRLNGRQKLHQLAARHRQHVETNQHQDNSYFSTLVSRYINQTKLLPSLNHSACFRTLKFCPNRDLITCFILTQQHFHTAVHRFFEDDF